VTSALAVIALSVGRADRRTSSGPGRNGPGSTCCQLRWQSSTRPPQPGLDQQPRRRPHGALGAFSRGPPAPRGWYATLLAIATPSASRRRPISGNECRTVRSAP